MPDKYNNYLAVTVDGKVYYLDKKSSCTFTTFHELPCKLKMLVGKISGRVHCEVKKVKLVFVVSKSWSLIRTIIVFGYRQDQRCVD